MKTSGYFSLKHFFNLRAIVTGVCALLLSTGPVCMSYMDNSTPLPDTINWLLIPLTLLTLSGILLTRYLYIPRLLFKDRLPVFLLMLVLTSFVINVAAVEVEYWFRMLFSLPLQSFFNPHSAWTYLYSFISCILLAFLLAGFSLWTLFEELQRQEKEEAGLRDEIKEKSRLFRLGIDLKKVKAMLDEAIASLGKKEQRVVTIIKELSEYLRHHLYANLPISFTTMPRDSISLSSHTVDFFTMPKYRVARHLYLLLSFLILASGMFFDRSDRPVFDTYNLISSILLFTILTSLGYFNIYVIFPSFLRTGRQKVYLRRVAIVTGVVYILLTGQGYLGDGLINRAGIRMPWYILPLAMGGTMLTFIFLFAGTASLVLIKKNLTEKWKISRMETELSRMELESLQARVNPHFLFNVLNNACILSYDNPEGAKATLTGVKEFLDYMIEETKRGVTTVGREADFLSNFLAMEESSGRPLDYSVECPRQLRHETIPVLLFITIVENAAKHSVVIDGRREINIRFIDSNDHLEFICTNTADSDNMQGAYPQFPTPRKSSGLGLYNTRRRLEILYGHNFSLITHISDNLFSVHLKIPFILDSSISTGKLILNHQSLSTSQTHEVSNSR